MPIVPLDFLTVADLLKNGSAVPLGEGSHRTAVGRAYYAAYLAAREAVRAAHRDPSKWVDHAALADGLAGASDPDVADIGVRLQMLKRNRHEADYKLAGSFSPNAVALVYANAKHVVEAAPRVVAQIPTNIPYSKR